jgi:fumarate reductase flavoprotein subunit
MTMLVAVLMVATPLVMAYEPGEYEATAPGFNGDLKVKVAFSDTQITAVEVLEHGETAGIGDAAIEKIPNAIVESQTLSVDAVTGASRTSEAIIAAVASCVELAGGDVDALKSKAEAQAEDVDTTTDKVEAVEVYTDVLVIGGGGAGLTAAIEAKRAGADVVVLERLSFLGGDTILAGGGIEAAGTPYQEMHGIVGDTPEAQREFILSRGITYRNPELLKVMTENAPDAVEFLVELGSDMTGRPVAGHGSPVERAHRAPSGSAGQNIMKPVITEVERLGIPVYFNTPGLELIASKGEVLGARGTNLEDGTPIEVHAKAVVIATGNFASNNEMVAEYDQRLKGIDTNSSAGSLGEGIKMAIAVGADLENMNIFRVTTGFPRGKNFIAISQDGERFMNEKHTDDTIFRKGDDLHILINENREEKHYFVVLDSAEYEANEKVYAPYMQTENGFSADTAEELAALIDLDEKVFANSIKMWNDAVAQQNDPLGRDMTEAKTLEKAPFYALKVRPKAHTCAGGIRIDVTAAVLNTQQQRIPGLFAAGEVTGGVHDGVSAVEGAIVYGRIAGQSAAEYALKLK